MAPSDLEAAPPGPPSDAASAAAPTITITVNAAAAEPPGVDTEAAFTTASPLHGAAKPEPWTCPRCTLENGAAQRECSACQTAKPGSTARSSLPPQHARSPARPAPHVHSSSSSFRFKFCYWLPYMLIGVACIAGLVYLASRAVIPVFHYLDDVDTGTWEATFPAGTCMETTTSSETQVACFRPFVLVDVTGVSAATAPVNVSGACAFTDPGGVTWGLLPDFNATTCTAQLGAGGSAAVTTPTTASGDALYRGDGWYNFDPSAYQLDAGKRGLATAVVLCLIAALLAALSCCLWFPCYRISKERVDYLFAEADGAGSPARKPQLCDADDRRNPLRCCCKAFVLVLLLPWALWYVATRCCVRSTQWSCNIVGRCMGAICAAIGRCCSAIWRCLRPCRNAVGRCCRATGGAIGACCAWFGDTCVRPVCRGVSWVCTGIGRCLGSVCGAFARCLDTVCGAVGRCLGSVCNCIGRCFSAVGRAVCACLRPVGKAVAACCAFVWGAISSCFRWLYHRVFAPCGRGIKTCCVATWRPIFAAVRAVWRSVCAPIGRGVAAACGAIGRTVAAVCRAVGGAVASVGRSVGNFLRRLFR